MKMTLDIPDRLYRQIKALAALKGQTIKAFFLDAIRAKLVSDQNEKNRLKRVGEPASARRTPLMSPTCSG